jgi:hypothetical protein
VVRPFVAGAVEDAGADDAGELEGLCAGFDECCSLGTSGVVEAVDGESPPEPWRSR